MSTNASASTGQGTDLRSRRTKRHLREALVELIAEHGYEAVTVVEICERAMVHRTTFYKHYPGKPELLADVLDERLAALMATIAAHPEVDPTALDPDDGVRLMLTDGAQRPRRPRVLRHPRAKGCREPRAPTHRRAAAAAARDARGYRGDCGARAACRAARPAARGAHRHAIIWWLNNDARLGPDDLAAVLAEELTGRR